IYEPVLSATARTRCRHSRPLDDQIPQRARRQHWRSSDPERRRRYCGDGVYSECSRRNHLTYGCVAGDARNKNDRGPHETARRERTNSRSVLVRASEGPTRVLPRLEIASAIRARAPANDGIWWNDLVRDGLT